MRIAVFGAGRMAEIRIEDMILDSRISEIAVINRSPQRAEALSAKFGVKVLPEEKFRPENFDSYVITTGTSHHAAALDLVIGPNRKIFCEKPIALELS
ncbi:MAG: Gfo/Idh/MocA family oxidoreductase, partial [Acidimicrobiaceae bacterium]